MRTALAAVALLAVVGCKEKPVAPAPTTTVYDSALQSVDGRFELRQRREDGGCRVQVVVKSADGERSLWTTQSCLPRAGMTFLSPNGERVLNLDLFPEMKTPSADWSSVPLLTVWSRGAVVRQYTGTEILGADQAADMSKVYSWVRGSTLEEAQRSARAAAGGERITIELVDGRVLTVGFEGNPLPAAAPAPRAPTEEPPVAAPTAPAATVAAPSLEPAGEPTVAMPRRTERSDAAVEAMAADETRLYSWEDQSGELHFGVGSQIPAKYRKRAVPVDATVGVVSVETPTSPAPAEQPAPAAGKPAPAPAAGQPAPAQPAQPAQPGATAPAGQPAAPRAQAQ